MKVSSVLVGCSLLASSAAGDALPGWPELARLRGWVTGTVTSSNPATLPSPSDRLTLRVGGDPRVVYELRENDVSISEPVISRDGTRIAFAKIEDEAGRKRRFLYTMPVGGVPMRRMAELEAPMVAPRGAHERLHNLAWSHDNTLLAYWGRLPRDQRAQGDTPLRIIDTRTGDIMVAATVAKRTLGEGYLGPVITDQAWAPDNRHLVLMRSEGDLVMLDVITHAETAIGRGAAATWSPDGETIAARVRHTRDPFGDADYVTISTAPPYTRKVVASYRAPKRAPDAPFTGALWYQGPALWSPDSRFLVVRRVVGEHEELYAIDRTTGKTRKLPPAFWETRSLGGRP
jgi:hypothetical protein